VAQLVKESRNDPSIKLANNLDLFYCAEHFTVAC
jgi:hypothetical protein